MTAVPSTWAYFGLASESPPASSGKGIASAPLSKKQETGFSDGCKILYSVWSDARQPSPYPGYMSPDGSGKTVVPLNRVAHHVQWIPTGKSAGAERC